MSRKLKGIAAAPGVAIAPIVHFHTTLDHIPTFKVGADAVAGEKQRFGQAIAIPCLVPPKYAAICLVQRNGVSKAHVHGTAM